MITTTTLLTNASVYSCIYSYHSGALIRDTTYNYSLHHTRARVSKYCSAITLSFFVFESDLKVDKKEDVNILILGETGVGKSTWINGIANYAKHNTLKDAMDDPDFTVLIPSR